MFYHFKIHRERNGYWAECLELEGCRTQADTLPELRVNMAEALNLYLDEPADSKVLFDLPRRIKRASGIEAVPVDPQVWFAAYLRRKRLERSLTQQEMARRLGLKNLYSYQRLESSKKANPTYNTIRKIREVLPGFKVEEVFA